MTSVEDEEQEERRDHDALHILPLSILPIETQGLSRARMIKNARLDSAVEMFRGLRSGSGQLMIDDLPSEFGWVNETNHNDYRILDKVSKLHSYDVYSLRISLRKLDIKVNDYDALRLSPEMSAELAPYMTEFTRPLIMQIYGDEAVDIQTFDDVVGLFRDPDIKRALERLRTMADKLGIKPEEVPDFIEDYGDVFLSLSYYRKCLATIEPIVDEFSGSMRELRTNYTARNDANLMETIDKLTNIIVSRMGEISSRMNSFEQGTRHMWENISAERFQKLRDVISANHVTIGGILCALAVKMDAWDEQFPKGRGGPGRRAEFIMVELRQGIDRIRSIEKAALSFTE